MKIYLMRHGESEGNEQKILCGWTDVPLTGKGREQARTAADNLSDIQFDRIFSSPLARALETAEIVAGDREIQLVEDLRERNLGDLEGLSWDEVEQRYPDVPVAWPGDPVGFAPPGGESTAQLYARCGAAVDGLISQNPGAGSILIVAHGAALACVLAHLLGQPPENAFRYKLNNCALAVVDIEEGFAMLQRLDECAGRLLPFRS